MPTIKDIAREAGVSHGTVSNVINKTGKVKVDKIRLVEATMKKLGYTYNTQAKQLRQGISKNVAVIFPSFIFQCYLDMYQSIQKALTSEGYNVIPYETSDIVNSEENILKSDALAGMSAVITVSCLENPQLYNNLQCPVLFINRIPKRNVQNGGVLTFDFQKAGSEIGEYIRKRGWKNIVYYSSSLQFQDSLFVNDGLRQALSDAGATIKQYSYDLPLVNNIAFELLQNNPGVEVVITTSLLLADAVTTAAHILQLTNLPQIISIAPYKQFPNSHYITYDMNYTYMGNIIARTLTEHVQNNQPIPKEKVISEQGFRFQFSNITKGEDCTLTLLTVPSPGAEALKILCPSFYKLTGIKLKITTIPYDNLLSEFQMQSQQFYFDLIRMDISWFTELASDIYKPLSQISDTLSVLPPHILHESYTDYTTVGQTMYALPFDPSVLVLLYRKDLFEDAVLKRAYYEIYHEPLEVPSTFEQYQKVARFFTKSINPNSPVDFGTSLTCGSYSVAASDFLPRLYAACPDLCKNESININNNAAQKALVEYIESYRYSSGQDHEWWKSSVIEFASGKSAMTITFSNYASYTTNKNYSKIVGKTGASLVPSGHPLLGGGLIGASKYTSKHDEILQFIRWYYSKDITSLIISLGGSAPLHDILDSYDFSLYPWLNIFSESLSIGTRNLNLPHIPDFPLRKFENILGSVVYNSIKGIMTPSEALQYAQNIYDTQFKSKP